MSRIIVAGGTGFFGAALVGLLRSEGIRPVLAARRIAAGRFEPRGLVPADKQVEAVQLIEYLATLGVQLVRLEGPADP